MGKIMAVCISEKRGTQKKNIEKVRLIENFGLEGDAHGGNWHRQVSLLSYEKVRVFEEKGISVEDGAFGENLLVEGFDFKTLPVGTRFRCGDVLLEMTQNVIAIARFIRQWGTASCPEKACLQGCSMAE